jgi:protein TonB
VILEKDDSSRRPRPWFAGVSIGAHVLLVGLVVVGTALQKRAPEEKAVEVRFVGKGAGAGPPAAPPPPPGRKKQRRQPTQVARAEIPKVAPDPKPVQERPPQREPEPEDHGVEGGVQGGVVGGVVGGQVGGAVGGTVGGTGGGGAEPPPPPPPPPDRPKPKNVPPFVIARDQLEHPNPRMSEVFKQSHRGQTVSGMYKVCIGQDGHVFEVTPVKAIPGADDEIIGTIREEWLYKEQSVPVCFMYAFNISIVQ